MLITTKQYAEKYGKSYGAVRRLITAGRFSTAVKLGNVWAIDDAEPYPVETKDDAPYSGWREKYPVKRPGSKPRKVKPRPVRAVYAVLVRSLTLCNGIYVPAREEAVYASYEHDMAITAYQMQRQLAKQANDNPATVGGERREVRTVGYRLHLADKNDTAMATWMKAVEAGEVQDKDLIYMLSDGSEWTRKGYETKSETPDEGW